MVQRVVLTCLIAQSLVHTIRADAGTNLTGIAWNPAATRFMIASASHEGTVVIWASPNSSTAYEEPESGALGLNRGTPGKDRPPGGPSSSHGGGLQNFYRRAEASRLFFGDPGQGTSDGHMATLTSSPNFTQVDFRETHGDFRDDGGHSDFGLTAINGEPEGDEEALSRFVESPTDGEFAHSPIISPVDPPDAPAAEGKRTIYFAH